MGHICSGLGTTPSKLARLPKRQAGEFLLNAVSFLKDEGNKGSTIAGYVKSLRSWWRFNDLEVTKPVKLRHDDGLYDNERIPSAAELHSIFEHADLQKKVCCALMAFAGFRPQVLGNRDSNDGLKVSDFPEMVFMESLPVKPGKRLEHTCESGEKHEFTGRDDWSIDSGEGETVHRLYMVRHYLNRVIEAGYYRLRLLK